MCSSQPLTTASMELNFSHFILNQCNGMCLQQTMLIMRLVHHTKLPFFSTVDLLEKFPAIDSIVNSSLAGNF